MSTGETKKALDTPLLPADSSANVRTGRDGLRLFQDGELGKKKRAKGYAERMSASYACFSAPRKEGLLAAG